MEKNLGIQDVRNCGNGLLFRELHDFLASCADESLSKRVNQGVASILEKKVDKLRELLAMDWNVNLSENVPKDVENERALLIQVPKTPSKAADKPTVFYKFSPLNQGKVQKFQCPHCDADYNLVRSLRDHIKLKHVGMEKLDKSLTDAKGHCKLPGKIDETEQCGITFETHQINRHLKVVHQIDIPKGKALRGWISKDNGQSWSPVFLSKSEPDPDYEIFIYEDNVDQQAARVDDGDEVQREEITEEENNRDKDNVHNEDEVPASGDLVHGAEGGATCREVGNNLALDEELVEPVTSDRSDEKIATSPEVVNEDPSSNVSDRSDEKKETSPEVVNEDPSSNVSDRSDEKKATSPEVANKDPCSNVAIVMEIDDEIETDTIDGVRIKRDEVTRNLFSTESTSKSSRFDDTPRLKVVAPDDGSQIIDIQYDSDTDQSDSRDFTFHRILQKQKRYDSRDTFDQAELKDLEGNKEVFVDFKDYLFMKKVSTQKDDKKNDKNINRILGHIITYKDSLLAYEAKKDPNFHLCDLTDFNGVNCKELKNPLDWIQENCTENPNRALEKLRAHSAFREFLLFKLSNTDMAGSFEKIAKKIGLRDGLEGITKAIADTKLYSRYQKAANNERAEVKEARFVLDPTHTNREANSIRTWHQSDEGKDEAEKQKQIYTQAMKDKTINPRQFNSFANYVRFLLCLCDKNRAGGYSFQNKHFYARQKQYYPDGYDSFAKLPEGWDSNIQPTADSEPSMWILRLPGNLASLKGKEAVEINVTKNMMRWLEMYRSLRDLSRKLTNQPEAESKDAMFFVNYTGSPLADIKSSRGNIWQKFETVTEVPRATITKCVRSAAEQVIQDNPEMANRVKRLNNHSAAVGSHVYDHNKYQYRAEFTNYMAKKDGEASADLGSDDEELTQRMKERDEADAEQSKGEALGIINRNNARKQATLSSQYRVKPEDRDYMQRLFTSEKFRGNFGKQFPGNISWHF